MRGLRVLDLSRILSGPFASMVLADLGADVIKIEDVDHGDDTRQWGLPFQGEDAAYFHSVNQNKRSVAIDLKNPYGRDLVLRLADSAGVLLEPPHRPRRCLQRALGPVPAAPRVARRTHIVSQAIPCS